MYKSLRLCLLGALTLSFIACGPTSDDLWARKALIAKQKQGALIVDVRTPEEYQAGHIAGAINVPHTEIRENLDKFGNDMTAPIAVYCGKGGRAEAARQALQREGYQNVWNLGSYGNLAQASKVQ